MWPPHALMEAAGFPPNANSEVTTRVLHSRKTKQAQVAYSKQLSMVEAAGVEPASENAVSKEPTYLVTFPRRCYPALSPTALRTDKKRSRPA